MHFCTCVVKRRDTQKHVVPGLGVVVLFCFARGHHRGVGMENGLRKPCGAGRKINGRIVVFFYLNFRRPLAAIGHQPVVAVCKGGHIFPYVKERVHTLKLGKNGFHTADKFGAEHQNVCIRKLQTIFYFVRRVAVVHGHGQRPHF